jgi:hypothetical protein
MNVCRLLVGNQEGKRRGRSVWSWVDNAKMGHGEI